MVNDLFRCNHASRLLRTWRHSAALVEMLTAYYCECSARMTPEGDSTASASRDDIPLHSVQKKCQEKPEGSFGEAALVEVILHHSRSASQALALLRAQPIESPPKGALP